MPLHYIIDGYNITNHAAFCSIRKRSRGPQETLLDFINNRNPQISRKNKITLVFDGYTNVPGGKSADNRIGVIFSCDESADVRIKRMVEGSKNPKDIIVVTDDREIKFFAKSLGAGTLSVEDFVNPQRKAAKKKEEAEKPGLNYTQAGRINEELRALWLKD